MVYSSQSSEIKMTTRNVIHYTDEYYELLDTVLDLKIDEATRNELATQIFKAIAAGEQVAYDGYDDGNVNGIGKLVES
jgi:ATP-dependent DNA ligase